MAIKNLGQVSGVYIGSTPPENIIMIWYDNTPSQMVHKVYNPGLSQWVVLDQNMISSITYSELVNIATNVGLTVGQWFKITDKSNAIALAVTSTKVQYSDSLGNILIDDLGSNIQYHVSSSNLSIDDVVGIFDEVNKKLVFQFSEQVPDYTADDYILGKVKRNNVWSLAKFKLSSFLSKVTGNSITWNGGFFFNFSSAITAILDKKGGVISKDTYDIDKQNITTDIQNVGKENQTIIENANTAITNATTATVIYDKQISAIETGGEPTDVATGDKLITIISKFQRYINKFKFAGGIKISKNFTDNLGGFINNNDSVESSLGKLQNEIKKSGIGDNIIISENTFNEIQGNIDKTDSITIGLSKIFYYVKHIITEYIVDNAVTTAKLVDNAVTTAKLVDNAVTTAKLANNLSLFSAVQVFITSNVNIFSGSLIFCDSQVQNNNQYFQDFGAPSFGPLIDNYYYGNVSGIINFLPVKSGDTQKLMGYGNILKNSIAESNRLFTLKLNLRSTGDNPPPTANIEARIIFADGGGDIVYKPLNYTESNNVSTDSNYLQAIIVLNDPHIFSQYGFKIWIKITY